MWQSLEKRKIGSDEFWVWSFLRAAADASSLPPYHYITEKKRNDLGKEISLAAKKLCCALRENELDGHLIHLDGQMFKGFFLYEDFSEMRQAEIDSAGDDRVKVTQIITGIAKRAIQKIQDEPQRGKIGKKAKLIRFVRLIAERNMRQYGEAFPADIAIAAHAIFRTEYSAKDVSMLLLRPPSQ
jgi:hypothetical protein